jgi:hypothetical protein
MSRPQKIHKPIKGDFNAILGAIALGSGTGKRAATKLARAKASAEVNPIKASEKTPPTPKKK